MESWSPEEIAQLATRIYNEKPDAPSTEVVPPPIPHALPSVPLPLPSPISLEPLRHRDSNAKEVTSEALLQSPLQMPSFQALKLAAASRNHPPYAPPTHAEPFVSMKPTVELSPTSLPTSTPSHWSRDRETDGLRSFIQRVRQPFTHDDLPKRASSGPQKFNPAKGDSFASRSLDIETIRRDFPILQQEVHGYPLAWMDNAATTQKPQQVIDAVSRFYESINSNIHRGAHTLAARATDAYENARRRIQVFLGASNPNEIVFVRGTTEGINLVAQTFGRKFLQPGDEIILSTLEHHANIVPWQMVAQQNQAVIKVIPVNDQGEVILEEYQRLLGPRTKLVALTQASNSLGTILPTQEMTSMAKRYGAKVLIDGAQSVAHIPVDLNTLECDFFVFSGHKIFGPTGIGAVFIRESLHDILPPWQGGGNMIQNVTFEETTYNGAPAKFEAGTPNIADAVGLHAALDYVDRIGLDRIAAYEHQLLQHATEGLMRIPTVRILGCAKDKVSVLSFVMHHRKTEEVGKYLDRYGIAVRSGHHCAQPSLRRFGVESTVRPSFTFYNTFEEIDRMLEALRRIR